MRRYRQGIAGGSITIKPDVGRLRVCRKGLGQADIRDCQDQDGGLGAEGARGGEGSSVCGGECAESRIGDRAMMRESYWITMDAFTPCTKKRA